MSRQYGAVGGVAIVLMVLNHAVHFGLQVSPVGEPWLTALSLVQALGVFSVPAFLFISGTFLAYSANLLSARFLRGQLTRILWPYLIWSGVFYLLLFAIDDVRYSAAGYGRHLLVGYPYHFVPILVFWYLAAPVAIRVGKRHGLVLLLSIGAYQALLLVLRFPNIFGLALPAWMGVLKPPVLFTTMSDWAIYFPLGLVVGMHDATVKRHLARWRHLLLAALALLGGVGILQAFHFISAPWVLFALPLPLTLLLPLAQREAIPAWRLFEVLGRRSYGIYLAHFVVITFAASLLKRPALALGPLSTLVLPALLIVSLGLPLLFMAAMARGVATRLAYRYLFGIVPPAGEARRRLA